ncbi:MAG: TIGR00266 family protein [Candidatus Spyradocola sp.]|jgi:uncharacterized protein (TIGR00266 family)
MKYRIEGGTLPVVTLLLDRGESIFTQSGGMSWMSDGIEMDTNMRGGLFKGLGRMFTGESLFLASYTARADGQQIALASSFPGSILALPIAPGREYICQKNAFLCATPGVEISVEVVQGLGRGLFGGEGFLLQRLHGSGLAFVEVDGSAIEKDLAPGERIKVDTGNVAVFASSVGYRVETVRGFKNVLFGGEGLFLTVLQGPGKVWLQTLSLPAFAGRLLPFLPTNNGSN